MSQQPAGASTGAQGPSVKGPVVCCQPTNPEPPKSEPCKHEKLEIKCGHGRSISIEEPLPPFAQTPLEVIAGPDSVSDEIQCITSVMEGPCSNHLNKVFDLDSNPPPTKDITTKTDSSLIFKAHSAGFLSKPLSFLWPSYPPSRWYSVRSNTCYGDFLSGDVKVYPDIQWSAKVSLKWNDEETTVDETEVGGTAGVKETTKGSGFTFSGDLGYTYDGATHKIGAEFEKRAERTFSIMSKAAKSFKRISNEISKLGSTKFEWKYPALNDLSGNWGWQEHPSEPHCCYVFSVKFDVLLLGGEFTVDIEKALLQALTAGAGTALVALLKKAEEKGVELSAKFICSGQLALSGQWQYKISDHGKDLPPSPMKLDLGLDFTLKGVMKIKLDAWIFSISAGGELGIQTGFKGSASGLTRDRKILIDWLLDWNGIMFFVKVQSPQGTSKKSTTKQKKFKDKKNKGKVKKQTEKQQDSYGGAYDFTAVLVEPTTLIKGQFVLIDNT